MCCSGLTCARASSAPGWWRNTCLYSSIHSHWTRVNGLSTFFITDVVMYWEAKMRIHQHKHTLAEPCLFVLRVIYNKQYCRCIVRFKLNRGPSACRTVCGQWRTVGFVFFPRTVPSLIFSFMFTEICNYFKIYSFREKNHIFVFFIKNNTL